MDGSQLMDFVDTAGGVSVAHHSGWSLKRLLIAAAALVFF
jgi:hypothetical protein